MIDHQSIIDGFRTQLGSPFTHGSLALALWVNSKETEQGAEALWESKEVTKKFNLFGFGDWLAAVIAFHAFLMIFLFLTWNRGITKSFVAIVGLCQAILTTAYVNNSVTYPSTAE